MRQYPLHEQIFVRYLSPEVLLDVNLDDFYASHTWGTGLKVIIHEPHNAPRMNEQSIAIQPGVEAYVSIEKHIVKRLPKPYSDVNCVVNEDIVDFKYKSDYRLADTYTFERCMLDCLLYHSIQQCNCGFKKHGSDACTLADYYFCIGPRQREYYNKCDCKKPCEQTTYNIQLTTLQLPTPFLMDLLNSHNFTYKTGEEIRRNVIALNVFYPSLYYTVTEQVEAFTLDELISNLGGQLGLFLGASLMTMVELVEALGIITCSWCNRIKKIVAKHDRFSINAC